MVLYPLSPKTVFFSVESRRGSSTVDGSKNGDAFPPEINTTDGKLPRDRNSDQSDRTSHNTKTLAEEKNSPLKDQTKLSIQGEPENNVDLYCEAHGKTNMNLCLGLVVWFQTSVVFEICL